MATPNAAAQRPAPAGTVLVALLALAGALPAAATEPPDGTVLDTAKLDLMGDVYDGQRGIAVQADGKALLSGWTQDFGTGRRVLAVLRLLANGSLDPAFGSGGEVVNPFPAVTSSYEGHAIAVQADGRIVVAGSLWLASGDRDFFVARLFADGTPDGSFGFGGIMGVPFDLGGSLVDEAWAVALGPGGTIVVAGTATWSATDTDFAVARLTSAGVLDTTFGGDGKVTIAFDLGATDRFDVARDVVELGGGRIALAGYAHRTDGNGDDFAVARLLADGALDSGFGTAGRVTFGWNLGGSRSDRGEAILAQPDGRLVVVGTSWALSDQTLWAAARLTGAGALDPSFGLNGSGLVFGSYCSLGCAAYADTGTGAALQGNGRILIGGAATPGAEDAEAGVARLTPNGALDPTWGGDGAVLVGGQSYLGGFYNVRLALGPEGRPRLGGTIGDGIVNLTTDFGYARFANAYLFADGVERGATSAWSSTAP